MTQQFEEIHPAPETLKEHVEWLINPDASLPRLLKLPIVPLIGDKVLLLNSGSGRQPLLSLPAKQYRSTRLEAMQQKANGQDDKKHPDVEWWLFPNGKQASISRLSRNFIKDYVLDRQYSHESIGPAEPLYCYNAYSHQIKLTNRALVGVAAVANPTHVDAEVKQIPFTIKLDIDPDSLSLGSEYLKRLPNPDKPFSLLTVNEGLTRLEEQYTRASQATGSAARFAPPTDDTIQILTRIEATRTLNTTPEAA